MRITHVVPHIDQEASGPSYSVPRLCQAQADCGNTVELKCLAANVPIPGVQLTLHRQWSVLGSFAVSTDMARALRRAAREADIVHNHSLWSMVNVAAGCLVPGHRAKLVTSPRGTLAPWALNRRKHIKRMLWRLQKRVLARADLLHATSEAEYFAIRALGFRAPVLVIPNGIDLPVPQPRHCGSIRTLLFLGRIHPVKGIDCLLRSWQRLEDKYVNWRLVIAGNGKPRHVEHAKQLAASLDLRRVMFPGPLYGNAKSAAYNDADLFVLPSYSENFGMVVAEALAHGCPAIVSRGAPWSGLETEGCGWWVERDVDTLVHTLDGAMRLMPERLAEMGARGRAWMASDFSWAGVGRQMDAAYRWLLKGGEPPARVRIE